MSSLYIASSLPSSSIVSIEANTTKKAKARNEQNYDNQYQHRKFEVFLTPGDVKAVRLATMEENRYVHGDCRAYSVISMDDEPAYEEMLWDLNRTYNAIDIADENLENLIQRGKLYRDELRKGFMAVNFNPDLKCFNRVVLAEDHDVEIGAVLYKEIDTGIEKIACLEYLFPIVDEKFRDLPGKHQIITLAGLSHFSALTTLRRIFETEVYPVERPNGKIIHHQLSVELADEGELSNGQKRHILYSSLYPGETINDRMLRAVIKYECQFPMKKISTNHLTFDTYLTYVNPDSTVYYTWRNDPIYIYFQDLLLLYKDEILKRVNDESCTLEILEQNPSTLKYFTTWGVGEIFRVQLVSSTNEMEKENVVLKESRFIFEQGDKKRIKVTYIDYGNEDYVNPANLVPAKDVHEFFESISPLCFKAIYHGEKECTDTDCEYLNLNCTGFPVSFAKVYEDKKVKLVNVMNLAQGDLAGFASTQIMRDCICDVGVKDEELASIFQKFNIEVESKSKSSSSIQPIESSSSITSDESDDEEINIFTKPSLKGRDSGRHYLGGS